MPWQRPTCYASSWLAIFCGHSVQILCHEKSSPLAPKSKWDILRYCMASTTTCSFISYYQHLNFSELFSQELDSKMLARGSRFLWFLQAVLQLPLGSTLALHREPQAMLCKWVFACSVWPGYKWQNCQHFWQFWRKLTGNSNQIQTN